MRILVTLAVGAGLLACFSCPSGSRYRPPDASWRADVLSVTASPVDLRFLNDVPAGARGFVRASGARLEFEDGTPARFWGGNLAAHALFVNDEEIEVQARRIAMLGFNLMRIHHHDSTRWVRPSVIDTSRDDSRQLDTAAMDRLDAWIRELKRNGVYVWLDLHVGRQFQPGDVQSPHGTMVGYEEIADDGKEAKGFAFYNDAVRALMKEFNQRYLTHRNPYTGLRYVDDPAIVGVLITNENDLTHHFGQKLLPDKGNPIHHAIFRERLRAFAARTGLPAAALERTWEPGPAKLLLNDDEHRFYADVLGHLTSIGLRVPAATTSLWGGDPLYSLPALTAGGIIDVHAYGGAEALSADPRRESSYVHWLGAAQLVDTPLSVTEWNAPYPTPDRFTAPLYVASIAALQGFDAVMIYNYSQERSFELRGPVPEWSIFADPAIVGVMPAAALLYRMAHVAPARQEYCLDLDRRQAFFEEITPDTSPAIRSLVEQSGIRVCLPDVPELEWDRAHPPGAGVLRVRDPGRSFLPADEDQVVSDTGELRRDWRAGIQTIDTGRTQAASGWLGGRAIQLSETRIELSTPKAVIAVSSLDDEELARSGHILITALAQAASSDGLLPLRAEPVVGRLSLAARPGLVLFPIRPDGSDGPALGARYDGTRYSVALDGSWHWLVLREAAAPPGAGLD